jgi:hypothetical protein
MWFLKACFLLSLPVPVSLKRFFAPEFVLTFGIIEKLMIIYSNKELYRSLVIIFS